jgi:hypothetical protein
MIDWIDILKCCWWVVDGLIEERRRSIEIGNECSWK